jgi:plasmid stabilization system protein ParE
MNFSFHPDAEEELDEAAAHYENCRPGLGAEFTEEVYATIARILRYPRAWPKASSLARRCLMNRFPYAVIYQVKSGAIRIYAVAHLNRLPGYWKSRERDRDPST